MDLDLAYVAGFFDGEGSIGVYLRRTGRTYGLETTLVQNGGQASDALHDELVSRWGGSTGRSSSGVWRWHLCGKKAAIFLQDIRPWLRIKAAQADLAILFQAPKARQVRTYNHETFMRDSKIAQELRELKK